MKLTFCGLGALGSHALLLCRNLDVDLSGIDFDRVESKNVAAQFHTKQLVGRFKAEAARLQMLNLFGRTMESYPVRLNAANVTELCGSSGLLVDCFDNAASRRVLSEFASTRAMPLVHAGISADGSFGLVRWEERFAPDEADEPGQATCEGGEHLPLIGLVASTLAVVIEDFVRDGRRRDVMITRQRSTTTYEDG